MSLLEKIQADIVTAMKAKDELRLNTLRSVKTALDRYRTDQQKPLDETVEQNILNTLCKQRKEAAEAFRTGGRIEMADKEDAELLVLQGYMLQEATEDQIDEAVAAAVHALQAASSIPLSMKSMGTIMKDVTARLTGFRVDGKIVSGKVKAILT